MSDFEIGFLGAATLAGVICALAVWAESTSCHAAWSRSGLATDYTIMGGCVVQMPDGRWIPSDRVRDIEIRK